MMRVQNLLHWCLNCRAFSIDCDPTGDVASQEGHNVQVLSLDTRTKNIHPTRDDVGRNDLRNLQATLLKLVCNA